MKCPLSVLKKKLDTFRVKMESQANRVPMAPLAQ